MAVLKFRIYFEEDDSVYRDIVIQHTQNFQDLHYAILKSYEFDNKHKATFFRSNDNWDKGREITFEKYEKNYRAEPLIMSETIIGSEIRDTNQKFVYQYDFEKNWMFNIELINVSKEASSKTVYPSTSRVEGIGPQQYGVKSLLGNKFVDIEEKYDLPKAIEGFSEEGEDAVNGDAEETAGEENFGEEANEEL